jgi:anti-sigma B factor antagonist
LGQAHEDGRTIVLFDVQRREREGWTVLAVIGELDLAAVPRVRQLVQQALRPVDSGSGTTGSAPRIILDLSSVDFLDSAGLGVVLGVVRRARQAGGEAAVVLVAPSPAARVFATLDLDLIVPVGADVDEVLERARSGPLLAGPALPGDSVPRPVLAGEVGGADG